ncbi:MAG: 2-oxoglutarate oxidoreductase [Oscillospiraceae bacterium]|jgi:2-oxoglutarate ferredoxin oxidoreductase subunit beta|nr:2-oxoglutarate oxidoreductase [Oscillospiraceae bacterium]
MAITKQIPDTIFAANSFCPGCGHGIVIRLIAEVLDEMDLSDRTIGVLAVGCSCLVNRTLAVDLMQSAHGRATAAAAGIKRTRPGNLVFTYQGDGDAISIGIAETLYSAQRDEKITQIIVNNGVFGMTGGQMSPTTLVGQRTATSEKGRNSEINGDPVNIMKLLSQFNTAYLARGSVHDAANILKTKQYIRTAFELQMRGEGFTCVEVISPCPTNWHMTPDQAVERIANEVLEVYPLGEFVKGEHQK